MKDIFTYPNDSSSHYIDPDYVGDDTVGFQKRIKELKDGDFKAHVGTAPTESVDNIMEALSKYNQHPSLEESNGNNSVYKFWEAPILDADLELIESDISSATAVHQTTSNIEFSSNHGFYQGQFMTLSNFNNSWSGLNGNDYYVKKIDNDTIQLAIDSDLTNLVEFYDLKDPDISSATAVHQTTSDFNFASAHELTQGMQVQLNSFNGSLSELNDDIFYVKVIDSDTVQLALDSNLTQLIEFYDLKDPEISSATAQHETIANFNFGSAHGLTEGMIVEPNSFNGSFTGINDNDYYVKVIDSTTVQLATDSGLSNLIKFYNGANGYLTAASPKKYASDASLTLSPNAGDINTLSDGDVISFSNLTPSTHDWVSSLTGTLYAGNVSGTDFRVYTDQARTNEVAPYHLASSEDNTATVSGNVVITHPTAAATRNVDYVNGMPIHVSGFDGTFGEEYNDTLMYVQNYNSGARTMNVSTDSAGNNLAYYAPNETDVDLDTVELHSDNSISIKIDERLIKLPDETPINLESTTGGTLSTIFHTLTGNINFDWVSTTRFAALVNNAEIRFYDYTKATHTITQDTGDTISTAQVDSGQGMTGIFHNPNWNTLAVCEYNFDTVTNLTDRLYVITDSGSGYSTDTVDMSTEISTFGGFTGSRSIAVSDNGLTMVIGDPHYGLTGTAVSGNAAGRVYIFERSSLSDDFDFANPDAEFTGQSNTRIGTDIILSGDGKVILAGSWDNSEPYLFYKNTSDVWSRDTTNTLPQYSSSELRLDIGAWLNDTGTLLVAHTGSGTSGPTHILSRTANNTAWSIDTTYNDQLYIVEDGDYLIDRNSPYTIYKRSGSSYSTVTSPISNTTGVIGQQPTTFIGPGADDTLAAYIVESHTGLYYYVGLDFNNDNVRVWDYTHTDAQIHNHLYNNNSNTYYLDYVATAGGKDEYKLYTDEDLTTTASWAALDSFSAGEVDMDTAFEMEIAPTYTPSTEGDLEEQDNTTSNYVASINYNAPTFSSTTNTFTESYTPAGAHEFYFAGSLSNATTGELVEQYTAPTPNIIVLKGPLADATTGEMVEQYTAPTSNIIVLKGPLTGATSGTITIESNETYRYRLQNDRIILPGNTAYLQRTGESTYVNNARIATGSYVLAGGNFRSDYAHWPGDMTVTTNSSGYITNFSTVSDLPGQLPYGASIMFSVEAVPDTYSAPALSLAAQEDIFDTAEEFNDTGYNGGIKEWPNKNDSYYKGPSSIKFRNEFYNSSSEAQDGTVFTRAGEFQKMFMEVSYPPLTEAQFGPMQRFALAVQGTYNPFYFIVHGNNPQRFLPNANIDCGTVTTRMLEDISVGSRTAMLSGYRSNQPDAIIAGEPIITGSAKSNGNIVHAINGVDANIYGEAKVKFNVPLSVSYITGQEIYQDPFHVIVTLDNEAFEFDKGTDGLYRVRVTFRAAKFLGG